MSDPWYDFWRDTFRAIEDDRNRKVNYSVCFFCQADPEFRTEVVGWGIVSTCREHKDWHYLRDSAVASQPLNGPRTKGDDWDDKNTAFYIKSKTRAVTEDWITARDRQVDRMVSVLEVNDNQLNLVWDQAGEKGASYWRPPVFENTV